MELNLTGRTALVTGASKGIGVASAECLAAEGVNVILVSRTQADLDAARQKIVGRCNVNVQVHAYDISDSTNVDRLAALHPDIDILVNNAGAIPGGNLQEIDGGAANRGPCSEEQRMNLQGKVAVVTGASGGIGSATARRFAEAGCRVVVGYNSRSDGAEKVAAELPGSGHRIARMPME